MLKAYSNDWQKSIKQADLSRPMLVAFIDKEKELAWLSYPIKWIGVVLKRSLRPYLLQPASRYAASAGSGSSDAAASL